jgi:hypothetical protein
VLRKNNNDGPAKQYLDEAFVAETLTATTHFSRRAIVTDLLIVNEAARNLCTAVIFARRKQTTRAYEMCSMEF